MKNLINIGIPSKGRLRKDVLNIFKKNKLKLFLKEVIEIYLVQLKIRKIFKSFIYMREK